MFQVPVTRTAARRILGCAVVEAVRTMRNGAIQVTYRHTEKSSRCSTFISRKAFERDFIEFRKAGARAITTVTPWVGKSDRFSVRSASQPDQPPYTVTIKGDRHTCNCPDWTGQRDAGSPNPICKHGFAVQNFLSAPISAQVGMRQVAKPKLVKKVLYHQAGPVVHAFTQVGNAEPKFYKTVRLDELQWMIETSQRNGWNVVDATAVVNSPATRQPYDFAQTSRGPVHI